MFVFSGNLTTLTEFSGNFATSSCFRGATKYYADTKYISFKKQVRQGAPEKARRRRS